MELSVIVLNWNTRELLERCLTSLRSALGNRAAEVFIVDNGSSDGSAAMVSERYPQWSLLANDRNRGFAAANNQAFAKATGEFILLLNNDVVLTRAALDALVATLRERPALAGTTGRLLNADGSTQYGYHRRRVTAWRLIGTLLHNGKLWRNNPWARSFLMLDSPLTAEQVIEQPAASCWLLRRSAINAAGGLFDERRYPIHFNDVELAERLLRQGGKTLLVPGAEVVHDGGTSVARLNPYLLKEHYLISEVLFLRSFRSFPEYLLLKAFFAVVCTVMLGLTRLNLLHLYFTTPITDRRASVAAQTRILKALLTESLPPTFD